jgi:carboxyl-terminal processing protease
MRGTVGLDYRWISDTLLITRLDRDGAAWAAGVRPGWTIESIEGIQVANHLLHAAKPELTPARRLKTAWQAVSDVLDGAVGDTTHVSFRDGEGSLRSLALDRRAPVKSSVSIAGLPSLPMEFEARAVSVASGGAIAVIRFTVFAPEVLSRSVEALDLLRAAGTLDGIVLDLRGNRGGYGPLIAGLGGLFLDRPCVLARMRTRDSELAYQSVPQPSTFHGPLALLVDGLTASTGEVFAGGLQSVGRARIFGDRTLGAALPSYTRSLPTGDLLQYVVADLRLPDGRRIEGSGVMPDEVVYPSRPALLQGRDPALEAASAWIVASRKSADPNTALRCQAGG